MICLPPGWLLSAFILHVRNFYSTWRGVLATPPPFHTFWAVDMSLFRFYHIKPDHSMLLLDVSFLTISPLCPLI